MVDVRIPADRAANLARRAGLRRLHDRRLARDRGSRCEQRIHRMRAGAIDRQRRHATATAAWHTRGHGVNFQPVSAFPEPGLMTWSDDGDRDDGTRAQRRVRRGMATRSRQPRPSVGASRSTTTRSTERAASRSFVRDRRVAHSPTGAVAGVARRVRRRSADGGGAARLRVQRRRAQRRQVDDHRVDHCRGEKARCSMSIA